jgi:probable HAF family extracellular repeat protein
MRALGNLRGDYWHNSQAWGLNDRGLVVGWASGTETLIDQTHGFVWEDGAMTDLGTLREQGFGASMARDVNDTGVVVGWSDTQAGTLDTNRHATLWRNAVITDLGLDRSWLNSINQFGQAVGAYFTADWDKHGLLWDPTHGLFDLHDLVTLGGAAARPLPSTTPARSLAGQATRAAPCMASASTWPRGPSGISAGRWRAWPPGSTRPGW